jgi:hypothetical protein
MKVEEGCMGLAVPGLPVSIRASALLNGSDEDFVINAYLALQRQWPDIGGYDHYLFLLRQPGASRAAVLREIATSDNGRRCGVQFIDDLPPDHEFRPEDHDRARLAELSLALRVGRMAADMEQLKASLAQLTPQGLAVAVEAIVQAQQAHLALLESRIEEVRALAAELHGLKATFESLQAEAPASYQFKRQVADYVNALVSVQQALPATPHAAGHA